MLLFSLEELDRIFGFVNLELIKKVWGDTRRIRKSYRRNHSFMETLKNATNKEILRSFFCYHTYSQCSLFEVDVMTDWDEFVSRSVDAGEFKQI